MASRTVDLLIVGAGLHGLAMAKTYLQVHPSAKLLVVDESQSVGGTWARERLYPGLKTNNLFGSYELGDFPMIPEKYGVQGTGHIPGDVVHAYLCDVADHFGITPHLALSTKVTSATPQDGGIWQVTLESLADPPHVQIVLATKLVIATGLTSNPHVPHVPGSETFGRLILHSKQLKERAESLARSRKVVVVGGNKSAWDVCYSAARSGSEVHMVIRPSGGGPSYVWPRFFRLGPYKVSLASLSRTRLFVLFDPAPLTGSGPFSWARKVLHRTSIGRRLTRWFWRNLDTRIRKLNGYDSHPELQKLAPWTTPFWMGNSLSIHNYETSWFDLVREGKIHVHITDLKSLSPGNVHLADGTSLDADALVFCTGWTTDIPVELDALATTLKDDEQCIKTIHAHVPYLSTTPRRTANAPVYEERSLSPKERASLPPLYRDIVPPQKPFLQHKNLAFIGMSISIHAVLVAQAQALWITAFLNDAIDHLRPDSYSFDIGKIEDNAILHSVYGRLRRPRETGGLAGRHADLVFDSLPYIDLLLRDLGVRSMRKEGWWRELMEDYRPGDYRGIVQEWMSLREMKGI